MRRSSHVFNRLYVNEVYGKEGSDVTVLPNGTGITIIGDAGSPGRLGTPTNDDLFVAGRTEMDGDLMCDANIYMAAATSLFVGSNAASNRFFNSAGELNLRHEANKTGNFFNIRNGAGLYLNASSGEQSFVRMAPNINQTGSAAYVALNIDVTETGTGSGATDLIKASVGTNDKFNVDAAGQCIQGAPTTSATLANSQVSLHLDEAGENLVFDIKESDGTAETVTIGYDP